MLYDKEDLKSIFERIIPNRVEQNDRMDIGYNQAIEHMKDNIKEEYDIDIN